MNTCDIPFKRPSPEFCQCGCRIVIEMLSSGFSTSMRSCICCPVHTKGLRYVVPYIYRCICGWQMMVWNYHESKGRPKYRIRDGL